MLQFLSILFFIRCLPADEEAFRKECESRLETAKTSTVLGIDGWHFYTHELKHVTNGAFSTPANFALIHPTQDEEERNPVAAISDLHQQLKAIGIRLIVVPAPLKVFVYADKLSPSFGGKQGEPIPRLDRHDREFHERLKQDGVTVIDALPLLLSHRRDPQGQMYCKTDTHWTSIACVQVARKIASEIVKMEWFGHVKRDSFETEFSTRQIVGDFRYLTGDGPAPPPENVPIRWVGSRTADGTRPIPIDGNSKVLLMTDSFGKVFHTGGEDEHGVGAGLPDQLAAELGMAVDLLAASGSAIRSARLDLKRRAIRDPRYLEGKKVIIWCFAGRHLTNQGSEWNKIQITP
ncbi:MAG: hypothetical protein O3B01_18820 [Planctomycetota bacterium]|nr:hypothetical protein [Planctomycetota bacterium]MDA1140626.1 hypothetical protein [Planctomycetota bacterium]